MLPFRLDGSLIPDAQSMEELFLMHYVYLKSNNMRKVSYSLFFSVYLLKEVEEKRKVLEGQEKE